MSVLSQMTDMVRGEQRNARTKIREIARRDALDQGKPADAKALQKLIAEANMSADEYDALVGLYRRVNHLRAEAAKADAEHEPKVVALANERRKLRDELQCFTNATHEKINAINNDIRNAEHALQLAQEAGAELQILEQHHQEELGTAKLDLDDYTLLSRGTVINACDPSAPTLYVSPDVFRRENYRRAELRRLACARAIERHNAAMVEWQQHGSRGKPPERVLPDWADLTKEDIAKLEHEIEPWR